MDWRSEEHTSELQSQSNLVCRLLLEKKKTAISPCTPSNTSTPYALPTAGASGPSTIRSPSLTSGQPRPTVDPVRPLHALLRCQLLLTSTTHRSIQALANIHTQLNCNLQRDGSGRAVINVGHVGEARVERVVTTNEQGVQALHIFFFLK